ncbi:2-keto-4-pentenoate hydratase [Coralloluteibacterium stylophorae]|uniref:2-keto-4-pentenoate hydratase n=1 Tax=Coralloluteibacterium stylophorae TaxID=1776034 RepID=A0A8J7VSG9_9GAMM|nr:2-keto-4-pentenoate hydratase [Coralloluteibacterium stylophorae]MBS7458171.1 2-keto-4-pentenoate hydratase [Coralloluteibacterium stylophorae]
MTTADANAIATAFVAARREARALPTYPGPIPADLDAAYAIQDAAIGRWGDAVAGWKVGAIAPTWRERYPEERLVGPVFARRVGRAGDPVALPVIDGGFAAVEAEYVVRVARDADPRRLDWTAEAAAGLVGALHIGVEFAASPFAGINDHGPGVTVSDFGNNAGLILGPELAGWDADGPECRTLLDGVEVGRGRPGSIPGGPLAAFAFALNRCARRGRPLRAGDLVTTGAATGIHPIAVGQHAEVRCGELAPIRCHAVAAAAEDAAR